MCVILMIEPGTTIPTDKLARACDINKHGYGLAYVHKSDLRVIRCLKDNDPAEIQSRLVKLKAHRVFLHLRHATVGSVSIENSHPMIVWEHSRRGIAMMHNGTLYDYSPKDKEKDTKSDTYYFARQWVSPLVERVAAFTTPKGVLADPVFRKALAKEVGFTSIILLFDSWGNVHIVNQDKGKQFDGFWASNEYSFNDNHTRSSAKSWHGQGYSEWDHEYHGGSAYGSYGAGSGYRTQQKPKTALPWAFYDLDDPTEDDLLLAWEKPKETPLQTEADKNEPVKDTPTPKHIVPYLMKESWPYTPGGNAKLRNSTVEVVKAIHSAKAQEKSIMNIVRDLTVQRLDFLKQSGLESLYEIGCLTTEDLIDLNTLHPEAMAQLTIDLFHLAGLAETARQKEELKSKAEAGSDV